MITPISEIVLAIQPALACRDVPYRTPFGGHRYTVYAIALVGRVVRADLIDAETGRLSTHDLDRPEVMTIYRTACPEASA